MQRDLVSWRILLIDDDEEDYLIVRGLLAKAHQDQFDLTWACSFKAGQQAIAERPYDAILVDYYLGSDRGIDLIREAAARGVRAPLLLLTGQASYETDIEAMEAGAADYLSKMEINPHLLERAIRYAIERKKNQEALQDSRAEMAGILDSINDGFFAFDRDWRYTYISHQAAQPLGFTPEDLIGKNVWEVFPKLRGTQAEVHYRLAMEQGLSSRYRIQGVYSGRWYDISVYPSKSGISVFTVDRTEQINAEQALRASEERFRLAVSTINEGLWDHDLTNGVMWWNDAYDRLYGPRPPESGNLSWWLERCHPDDRQHVTTSYQAAIGGGGEQWTCEYRFQRADGSYAYVSDRALITRDASGQAIRVTGAMLDLTELRQLEAQQIEDKTSLEVQRRLLEQREKERQSIARDIHDGPVQTLSSTVFNIQFTKEAFPDLALRVELDQIGLNIKSAVQELRQVINELRPPALLRFGLTRSIQIHANDFRERHPELHLELHLMADEPHLPEQVSLTLFRIYQEALNNIVRHAQASQVVVRFEHQPGQLALNIEDNGRGFPVPNDMMRLTQEGHFGLAGMNERAEAVDGQLMINSQNGAGTQVCALIPIDL